FVHAWFHVTGEWRSPILYRGARIGKGVKDEGENGGRGSAGAKAQPPNLGISQGLKALLPGLKSGASKASSEFPTPEGNAHRKTEVNPRTLGKQRVGIRP